MNLSENFLLKLKASCDIYSLFSSYVELKACGSNMRCCCPFHAEKTPSCFVYSDTQSFFCFGCGVGGDVITFVEKIENLSYIESVRFLAQKFGVSLPEQNLDDKFEKKKSLILKINKKAARFFHSNLFSENGADGLNYFKSRGVSKQTILKFGLGYALNDWCCLKNFLRHEGFLEKDLIASGLVLKSRNGRLYDKFRNRVIFPIINLKSEVIGFGGRILNSEGSPKYLNSAESLVFKKGFELFGLNFVKKAEIRTKFLILCEGYMDVISMHQYGFTNCVATLGTSLTKQQVQLISRSFSEVVLAYDADVAGKRAVSRASDMFENINVKVRVLKLSNAKDPDEYVKKFGPSRLKVLIEDSKSFENFVFDGLKAKFDSSNVEEKRELIKKTCVMISKMKDSIKREIYIGRLCGFLNLSKSVISSFVHGLITKNRNVEKQRLKNNFFNDSKKFTLTTRNFAENFKFVKAQEGIIRFLFKNPESYELVFKTVNLNFFDSELTMKIFKFLIENFKVGKTIGVSDLHLILSADEMSEFSRIVNGENEFEDTESELFEYVKILQEKIEKSKENVLKMSLEELELQRQKKAKLKI